MKIRFTNTEVIIPFESLTYQQWVDQYPLEATILDAHSNDSIVIVQQDGLYIDNNDLYKLSSVELDILGFPNFYPFSIYLDSSSISHNGIHPTFKKSAPTGEFLAFERLGVSLKSDTLSFLLDEVSYSILKRLDYASSDEFANFSVLHHIKKILEDANDKQLTHAIVLSDLLQETDVEIVDKLKVEPEIIDDSLRFQPVIDKDSTLLKKQFNLLPRVRSKYSLKMEGKTKRVLFDDKQVQALDKVKKFQPSLKEDGLEEVFDDPQLLFSQIDENYEEIFDLQYFSDRVIELGLYKPKFYPFIAPYKSQWIPGIQIKDKKNGTVNIPVRNREELDELEEIVKKAKINGQDAIQWREKELSTSSVDNIIPLLRKQINAPYKPITEEAEASQKKVLIIKENTLDLEYQTTAVTEFSLHPIEPIANLNPQITLKTHQEEGIRWLQTVYRNENEGCLLADDMGLGKTFQVLYFIEWYYQKTQSNKASIIISPISLLENWQQEYDKFFSKQTFSLEVHDSRSPIPKRYEPYFGKQIAGKKVLLTNYETIKSRQLTLATVDFGILVADEVQKIKTPGTLITNAVKALKGDFKIPMTGTPIENSFTDIWCIMDFSVPGFLGAAKEFSDEFQKSLRNPNTDRVELGNRLRDRIGNLMLRRMKTDVAKDLPNKIQHFIPLKMKLLQLEAYAAVADSYQEGKKGDALRVIQQLKQVSEHPYLISRNLIDVNIEELIHHSAKFEWLTQILNDIMVAKEKVIVFAEFREIQHAVSRLIQYKFGIRPSIINGDTPTKPSARDNAKLSRQQAIDRFSNFSDFNVIIMSPKAAGVGLNVVSANHVIHLSRHWNPAIENQATDRAYRIGQTKNVNVYYPICELPDASIKSFDQVLNELLNQKSYLAESALYPLELQEVSEDELGSALLGKKMDVYSNTLTVDDLSSMDPYYFEAFIAVLFDKQGFETYLTPKQNDMGVDVVAIGETNYLIQCKTSSKPIDKSAVSEVIIAQKHYEEKFDKTFKLMVSTNNKPNSTTQSIAEQYDVKIISIHELSELLTKCPITNKEVVLKEQQRQ